MSRHLSPLFTPFLRLLPCSRQKGKPFDRQSTSRLEQRGLRNPRFPLFKSFLHLLPCHQQREGHGYWQRTSRERQQTKSWANAH